MQKICRLYSVDIRHRKSLTESSDRKLEKLQQVQNFRYLEIVLTVKDGNCETDIRKRIGISKKYLPKSKKIIKNPTNVIRNKEKITDDAAINMDRRY